MKIVLIVLVVVILGGAIFWFNKEPAVAPDDALSPDDNVQPPILAICRPYVCTDGSKFPRCAESGVPINYLVSPCQYHGGEVMSQEGISSPAISPTTTPKTTKTPTPIPTPTEIPNPDLYNKRTYPIIFSSQGLNVANVTIRVGDEVQFINNDDAPHWPASGVHPTHQICPGFDSLRGLNKGESYSFTFNEAKTCPWHDHLNPSIKGQIIVVQ